MSGVLYYNSGWLSADILQAVGCKEIWGRAWVKVMEATASHELSHKQCRSITR